jgi:hypothetical protein
MKKLCTMREALSDPALLGDALPGDSWSAWRTLLIAAAGEPLTDAERVTFKALTGRDREPGEMIETILIVAGRRSGKTKAMATLSIYLSTLCSWEDNLSLGERGLALFMAPTERQAGVAHRYAEGIVDHVPLLKGLVESRTVNSLTLRRNIDLETQPASWRFSRGFTSVSVALDECAFLYCSDEAANSDTELLIALKPSLSTTGGPMLLTSSPSNMEGVVYRLWKRHHGAQGDPRCLVVQADSKTLNPCLRQTTIDRAYEDDPVAAAAEYGGEFRQPVTAYLDRAVVEKAIDKGVTGRTRLPGVTYRAHIDVSGGTGSDSFCVCIGHKMHDAGRDICVVDVLFEARPPFDPDVITEQAAQLLLQWGIDDATADSYAAGWPITAFARHGVRFHTAALTTSQLYLHTLPLWTAGRVSMLDVPRAVDQLCNLRRRLGQGGKETITHPRNAHDDLACVIAGLLWRLTPVAPRQVPIVSPSIFSNGRWWDDGQASTPPPSNFRPGHEPWRDFVGPDAVYSHWPGSDPAGREW